MCWAHLTRVVTTSPLGSFVAAVAAAAAIFGGGYRSIAPPSAREVAVEAPVLTVTCECSCPPAECEDSGPAASCSFECPSAQVIEVDPANVLDWKLAVIISLGFGVSFCSGVVVGCGCSYATRAQRSVTASRQLVPLSQW